MDTLIPIVPQSQHILFGVSANKDVKSRLKNYQAWLTEVKIPWWQPELDSYRDYLLLARRLSPTSVAAHLATIRGQYRRVLQDNGLRDMLYSLTPPDADFVEKKAAVDEMLIRLTNATNAQRSAVKTVVVQDTTAEAHLRLKPNQVQQLIAAPGCGSLSGIRATAIFALLACTGIREAELCALHVTDLRCHLGDELALLIRSGKGNKQRLVPYGEMDWCLNDVQSWLDAAGISAGAVFRGMDRHKNILSNAITTRSVNRIFQQYPVNIAGQYKLVQPHDLRRTYARLCYEAGLDVERIRQNLGHTSVATTQRYIGTLDASQRRPPAIFNREE